jgi:YHS domain-containing protein
MKTLLAFLLAAGAAVAQDFPTVPAADGAALDKLNQAGAVALPVAANTNVVSVNFSMAQSKANDAALEGLKPLAAQVVWLNLAGTAVTDAGLASLGALKNLQRLHLERTAVTDAGLAQLKGLADLRYLNLYGTKVTDAGLASLKGLSKLQSLYLWQTAVTDAGEKDLQAALPSLRINRGIEPPAKVVEEPKPAAKAVNAKCPVSGKDVDAAQTVTHEGQLIAFCCGNCKGQFEKEPAKFIGKVEGFKKKEEKKEEKKPDGKKAINAKCPVSGEAVDAGQTFEYKKQLIGFCCGDCKGKFEKEPGKFIAKVAEFKDPDKK